MLLRCPISFGISVLDQTRFERGRNYPNPFNPTTVGPFSLAEASHVSIRGDDLLGREVSVLVDGQLSAGAHQVAFEASALPTGVYLIRIKALFETRCSASCDKSNAEPGEIGPNRPFRMNVNTP